MVDIVGQYDPAPFPTIKKLVLCSLFYTSIDALPPETVVAAELCCMVLGRIVQALHFEF
jgi:hypothetical protein